MTSKQFNFSLVVGVMLTLLGGVVASQASIGISLMVLGVAIAALAVVTKLRGQSPEPKPTSALAPVE
ncbi:MAG: hypothetical protein AseanaTS_07460 [Candidatus Pelagadaptatus aseana]|uniref:hypothetical protein n=1 Tax=Candidatus Pelagadaptatus aseana TaxID=3120508 RepID=UPI0039B2EE67